MSQLLFAAILGIGVGGLYAMLATGLITAYKGSGVINFAHGAFAMYTVYVYDELTRSGSLVLPWVDMIPGSLSTPMVVSLGGPVGPGLAVPLALLVAVLLGLASHLLVFRPLRDSPVLAKVIGTVGIMIYLQAVASINFGTVGRQNPGFLPGTTGFDAYFTNAFGLGEDFRLPHLVAWIAASGVVVSVLVWSLLRFTSFGLLTRATDENERAAVMLGYSPQMIAAATWMLSALLAGIAGLITIGQGSLSYTSFNLLIVPALAAALIGNLASVPVAALGGFGIGILQSLFVQLAAFTWWPGWLPAAGIRELLPLLVVAVVLYVRGARLPLRDSPLMRRQARSLAAARIWPGIVGGAVLAAVLATLFSGAWEVALTTSIVTGIIMLSSVVLVGMLGQISFAQTALAGVAAYAAVRFATPHGHDGGGLPSGAGMPDPLAFLLGIGAAVLVGLLIGLPALRIRGVHLAIITMAAVGPISYLLLQNTVLMGPSAQSTVAVPHPTWFGLDVSSQNPETGLTDYWRFTAFALLAFAIAGIAVANLRRGVVGKRFLAIRANERAAASLGIDVSRTKLLGFAVSSVLAGVGGVLQAYQLGAIQPDTYGLFAGLLVLAFVYLGGITSVYGAVIGGLLVGGGIVSQALSEAAGADFSSYLTLIGAVALVLTAVLNPDGVATGVAWQLRSRRRSSAVEPTRQPGMAGAAG